MPGRFLCPRPPGRYPGGRWPRRRGRPPGAMTAAVWGEGRRRGLRGACTTPGHAPTPPHCSSSHISPSPAPTCHAVDLAHGLAKGGGLATGGEHGVEDAVQVSAVVKVPASDDGCVSGQGLGGGQHGLEGGWRGWAGEMDGWGLARRCQRRWPPLPTMVRRPHRGAHAAVTTWTRPAAFSPQNALGTSAHTWVARPGTPTPLVDGGSSPGGARSDSPAPVSMARCQSQEM